MGIRKYSVLHTGNLLLLLLEQKNHTKGYLFENNSCNKELFGISCLFWTIETWLAERYIVAIGYIAGWSLYVTERIIETVAGTILATPEYLPVLRYERYSYSLECCNSLSLRSWVLSESRVSGISPGPNSLHKKWDGRPKSEVTSESRW